MVHSRVFVLRGITSTFLVPNDPLGVVRGSATCYVMERQHVFQYHLKLRNGQLKAAMTRQHIAFSNVN